jgi:endonuclease/exonuclease/phosphatase family metal-dependent hydrolase
MITRIPACLLLVACSLSALPMASCKNQGGARTKTSAAAAAPDRPIVLDGSMSDWPERSAIIADADSIFFRINLEGQQYPLQASSETLALWIDLDSDAATGVQMPSPAAAGGMGIDAMVEFSPRSPEGSIKPGVSVYSVDASGARAPVPAAALEVIAAPTFAETSFEVRLSRHADAAAAPGLASALKHRGRGRALYVLSEGSGRQVGWSDPEQFAMPAAGDATPLSDAVVPPKEPGTVRVLSYNVLKSQLAKNPSPFARIFQVADADIILLQEWESDAPTAKAWFNAVVTGEHPWHAVTGPDVAIVSPHPIERLPPFPINTEESMGSQPRPVRVMGAVVNTPAGKIAAASLHLKCCGTAGSSEDMRRISEAQAINAAMFQAVPTSGAVAAVIAGDWNLVGSRTPLDIARANIDLDGTEMAVADPMVLGDAAMYTWRDTNQPFPPGRLDLLVYTDSSAEVVNAFVLDTARLSERALARMGLDRTDTAASDHLPVIVDLKPRR